MLDSAEQNKVLRVLQNKQKQQVISQKKHQ